MSLSISHYCITFSVFFLSKGTAHVLVTLAYKLWILLELHKLLVSFSVSDPDLVAECVN